MGLRHTSYPRKAGNKILYEKQNAFVLLRICAPPWLFSSYFMDTVHFVADHVFRVPLASWEVVAHSNILFVFRIKSRLLACRRAHKVPSNVVPVFSLTSVLLFPSTLTCLLSSNMSSSFLSQGFLNTFMFSLLRMFFSTPLSSNDSIPSDLPAPSLTTPSTTL